MKYRTFSDLLDGVKALQGVASYTTAEQTRVVSLLNRRLKDAYDTSRVWPRYLVGGESRYMDSDQVVAYEQESAVIVSGAGTDDVNGTYQPVDTNNGKIRYYKDGDTDSYQIYFDGDVWVIGSGTVDFYGSTSSGSEYPWLDDFTEVSYAGTAPAPTVTEGVRRDVSEFIRIHRTRPYFNNSAYEYTFFVDSAGAHVTNVSPSGESVAYVTYKAEWDGPYASDATTVPEEFSAYAIQAAYADILRQVGDVEKAQAEERAASEQLALECMRVEQLANNAILGTRIQSHLSQQSRYY